MAMYESEQLMGILGCLEGLVRVMAREQAASRSKHAAEPEEQERRDINRTWAVRLLGATAATRAAKSVPLLPMARERLEVAARIFRECLGDELFTSLLAEGQHLSLDDAVALALHSCPQEAVLL